MLDIEFPDFLSISDKGPLQKLLRKKEESERGLTYPGECRVNRTTGARISLPPRAGPSIPKIKRPVDYRRRRYFFRKILVESLLASVFAGRSMSADVSVIIATHNRAG